MDHFQEMYCMTSSVRIHGYYGHSQSTLTSIANEVEAEWSLGNAKWIPSPIVNVFWEGDRFWMRGISHRNQVAGNKPRGLKIAKRAAVFDPWGPLSGGSVIAVQFPSLVPSLKVGWGQDYVYPV